MSAEEQGRLGDFTALQVVGSALASSEVRPQLQVGDIVFITAPVTYTALQSQSQRGSVRRTKTEQMNSAWLTLHAEGTADSVVKLLDFPPFAFNSQTHLCLFEVKSCWFPAERNKKAEKEHGKQTAGRGILSGEELQLKHVLSGRYLAFSELAGAQGYQVTLEERTHRGSWLRLQRGPLTVIAGRPVLYHDPVLITGKCGSVNCFLSIFGRLSSDSTPLFDVFSSSQESYFQLHRFRPPISDISYLHLSQIVQFQHKELGYYLSVSSLQPDSHLVVVKNQYEALGYWRLEPMQSTEGGEILTSTRYFLRNVVTGAYLQSDLTATMTPTESSSFCLMGSKNNESVFEGLDLQLENNKNQRICIRTDEIQGQDVFKMIPTGKSKEPEKVVDLTLSRDYSEDSLFTFEIRKADKNADFVTKVAEMLPGMKRFCEFLRSFKREKETEFVEFCKITTNGLEFMGNTIEAAKSKEQMSRFQNVLLSCNLPRLLLEISHMLVSHLGSDSQISLGRKAVLQSRSLQKASLMAGFRMVIPAVLSLLNHMTYLNFECSAHLAQLNNEICHLFPYSKKLTAALLTEIYTIIDPPIEDYTAFYDQWFDRLQTVSRENVEEQTAFVKLLRHVSESTEEVDALAQTQLLRLFEDREKKFSMIELKETNGETWVKFKVKDGNKADILGMNPDLKGVRHEDDFFALSDFGSSKFLLKYANYISEVLFLLSTACHEFEHAIWAIQRAVGLTPHLVLKLSTDPRVCVPLRSGFLVLSINVILAHEATDSKRMTQVSTLVVVSELGVEVESPTEEIKQLVEWCRDIWTKDYKVEVGARETLKFIKAVLKVTHSILVRGYGGAGLISAICPGLETLLIALVNPGGQYLPSDHWAQILMARVKEERETFQLGINHLLKQVTADTISQLKRIYDYLNTNKVHRLLIHYTQPAPRPLRDVILEHLLEDRKRMKEFLGTSAFCQLDIDTDTRNEMMSLLVTLLHRPRLLGESLQNTQLVQDTNLLQIRARFAIIAPLLAVAKSDSKLAHLLSSSEGSGLQTVIDALTKLLALLTPRGGRPDLLQSTQDMARHFDMHHILVRLWSAVDAKLRRDSRTELMSLLRLTVDNLYYFVLDCDRNRLEVLRLTRSSFFDVRTRNSAYIIRELTDFEHVPQTSASLCYKAILQRSAEDPAFFNGLCWIRASMRRRETHKCKSDLQVIAALAIREHIRRFSIVNPELTTYFSHVILLLSEAAEENPLVQAQNQALVPASDLLSALRVCEDPRLFSAWIRFLAESQIPLDSSQGEEVLSLIEKWLDRAIEAVGALQTVAFSGWYSKAYPMKNPELVDMHGDMSGANEKCAIWEMLSTGDFWKLEMGLCHSLPQVLGLVSQFPLAIKEIAGKMRVLLTRINDVERRNTETVDFFYLQRAVGGCFESLSLWLQGKRGSILTDPFTAAALKDPDTIDHVVSEATMTARRMLTRKDVEAANVSLHEFATNVVRVCAEQSPAPSYAIKGILFTIPVFAELKKPSVPYKARADATIVIKMTSRKLDLEHRHAFFETLAALLDECRDKLMVKDVFTASGVAATAIETLAERSDLRAMKGALRLLRKLLSVLGVDFQNWLLSYLESSEKYMGIFQLLASELTCSLDRVLFRKVHSGAAACLVPSERTLLPGFFTSGLSIHSLVSLNAELTLELVRFVTNCCDGCHTEFQLFMSQQNRTAVEERGTVNVVNLLVHFVMKLAADVNVLLTDGQGREMLGACCEALVELVTGPCEENQERLGADVQLLSAFVRLMELATIHRNERDWYVLLQGILDFLHALLEGSPSPAQVNCMGKYLNIPLLTSAMDAIYKEHIQGREREVLLGNLTRAQEANVDIGFSIAMLVMKLRGVLPRHADLIDYGEESWSEGLVFSMIDLPVFRHLPRNCFGFYGALIGYVEISRNGKIEANYFRIPAECKFLTQRSKEHVISNSMSTSQLQKLYSLLQMAELYHVEMQHQQHLYTRPFLKTLSQSWQFFGLASFILIITLNIVLLIAGTFDSVTYLDEDERGTDFSRAIVILGSVQLGVSFLSLMGFTYEYYPNIFTRAASKQVEELQFLDYPEIWHNESVVVNVIRETSSIKRQLPRLLVLLLDREIAYHLVLLIVSLAAIFVPSLYCLLLFDIFKRSKDLVVLVHSLTNVWKQLLNTVLIIILATYFFAVVLLMFFTQYIDGSNPLLSADSLWDCFVASCIVGVRYDDGGLSIAMSNAYLDEELYYPRILFDLLYFSIVVLVIPNIITGVIVDAFGDMRVQKQKLDEEMNQKCFICGVSRQATENRGNGWSHHFLNEHSIFSYLGFIIYVSALNDNNCTGLEKYVKDCLHRNSCEFFPQTSRQLQLLENEEAENK